LSKNSIHKSSASPKESREEYIKNVEAAIAANVQARLFYFPLNWRERREMNQRLGREIGAGLEPWTALGWNDLYSRLIVRNSLDSTGVSIDCGEFGASIREGIRRAQESCP